MATSFLDPDFDADVGVVEMGKAGHEPHVGTPYNDDNIHWCMGERPSIQVPGSTWERVSQVSTFEICEMHDDRHTGFLGSG